MICTSYVRMKSLSERFNLLRTISSNFFSLSDNNYDSSGYDISNWISRSVFRLSISFSIFRDVSLPMFAGDIYTSLSMRCHITLTPSSLLVLSLRRSFYWSPV